MAFAAARMIKEKKELENRKKSSEGMQQSATKQVNKERVKKQENC